MIARRFPEINWLKQQIEQRFRNRKGMGNLQLEQEGFPSVIIHTESRSAYRPDIVGPISLFSNRKGNSVCVLDGKRFVVSDEMFVLSNRYQPYTLEIDEPSGTETFNVHIGEYFSEQWLAGMLQDSDTLLNQGKQLEIPTVAFHNQLHRKDEQLMSLLHRLEHTAADKMAHEETQADLLFYLLQQHRNILAQIEKMPAAKAATRLELYKRIAAATDYLHSYYRKSVDLDALAEAACLSKFHMLRLFRHIHKISPYQYLQQLRMQKAEDLLRKSDKTVEHIADALGFENSASFSRLFRQRSGVYPSQYRQLVN
jgi:AraC family transcriptional regulator